MSTVETLFMKLVAHPFIDDAGRLVVAATSVSCVSRTQSKNMKDGLVVLALEPCHAGALMKVRHVEVELVRAQTSIPNHVPFFVLILLHGEVSLDVRTITYRSMYMYLYLLHIPNIW